MDPKQGKEKTDNTLGEAIASTEPTTPAASPAAPATPATPAATPDLDDPEVRELREAEEQARREVEGTTEPAAPAAAASTPAAASASAPAQPAAAAPAATQPAASAPAAAAPGAKAAEKTVPISALAKERQARAQAEARANYERGRADALAAVATTSGQPGQPAGEPELTPEEQELQEIKAKKKDLAAQADKGTISLAEWEEQRDALEDRAAELRAVINAPAPARSPQADDLTLAERTAQLETQYPAVKNLSEAETDSLVTLAYAQARREGKPIGEGPAATLQLRERVAKLAQTMYGGGQPAAASAASQPATGSTTPAQPALSPAAQARATKLEQAATHPPDVSTMGSASTGTGVSEAELLARLEHATTEEEAEAIMRGAPQVVNRVMGRVPAS